MVVTSTVKYVGNTGSSAGSFTSGQMSFASGTRIAISAGCGRDGHTNGLGATVTITDTAAASLTWTPLVATALDTSQGATYGARSYLYVSSELSSAETNITVSVDPGTSNYFIGLIVREVDGSDGTLIDFGTYADEPEPGTPSGLANPTSGDYQTYDAFGQSEGTISSFDAPPTNFADQAGGEDRTDLVCVNAMESSTNTDGTVSFGCTPGGPATLYNWHLIHASWNEGAAGPVAGTARAAVGAVGVPTGSKVATSGSGRSPLGVASVPTGTKIAQGSVSTVGSVVGRPTGTKIAQGVASTVGSVIGRPTGVKLAQGVASTVGSVIGRVTGTGSDIVAGSAQAVVGLVARATGTKIATGGARSGYSVVVRSTAGKIATGAVTSAGSVVARAAGASGAIPQGAARVAVSIVGRISGLKVGQGGARSSLAVSSTARGAKVGEGSARAVLGLVGDAPGTRTALGGARAALVAVARSTALKLATGAARATHGIVGSSSQVPLIPPLDVRHHSTAERQHTGLASRGHLAEVTRSHRGIVS